MEVRVHLRNAFPGGIGNLGSERKENEKKRGGKFHFQKQIEDR